MKYLAFITFLSLTFVGFGGNSYKIEVSVLDEATKVPIPGVRIQFKTSKNLLLFTTYTDENGRAQYDECKAKIVWINAQKTNNDDYSEYEYYYDQKAEAQIPITIRLTNYAVFREMTAKLTVATPIDSAELKKTKDCNDELVEASFPGGQTALAKFLQENIKYPERALDHGIGGRCYLQFYVDPKGVISNIKVTRGISNCPDCDYEAVLVITKMPKWIPSECKGEKVGIFYNLPIKFTPG